MSHGRVNIPGRIVELRTANSYYEHGGHTFAESATVEKNGERFFVVRHDRDHGPFSLVAAQLESGNQHRVEGYTAKGESARGWLYQPIHRDMAAEDIEGSTYYHDDGTSFLFAPCSPHQQVNFAAVAERFCYSAFQEHIDRALNSGQTGAATKARALIDFASQAGRDAFTTVRMATLGFYHRDPHDDHLRDLAHASIVKIWTGWLKNASRVTDRAAIRSIVGTVGARLRTDYTIEWRHERAPILAAQGQDPISGKEYCYTLSATADAIAGDANPTESKPYVIRFERPVPLGTSPGVSIGSVTWVQGAAYKPS